VNPPTFQIRLCENPSCGLRYPVTENHPFGDRCPACFGATRLVLTRSPASELKLNPRIIKLTPVEVLLDNIRSAWNVGSIFRSAEGYGVQHIHLCGITPTPEAADLSKTALGAELSIPWTYHKNSVVAGAGLRKSGRRLWALEEDPRALPITEAGTPRGAARAPQGRVLVVGNELAGVDPELLDLCHQIIYLPMQGKKRSFNVAVAFGIAIHFLNFLDQQDKIAG